MDERPQAARLAVPNAARTRSRLRAVIELGLLALHSSGSFSWDGSVYALEGGELFSNGFRYMNWSIDVPVLLTQLLIVAGITGAAFRKRWASFVVAGLGMIWTGYVGQFDEVAGGTQFWLWGAISTVFYVWLLYVAWQTIRDARQTAPENVRDSSEPCGSSSSCRGPSIPSPT